MTEAQLRVLVTVADTGGFSPAAARLSMSQPGVSRAVAALEAELGTALLVRRNGRAAPTPAGERVLRHAREVLARAEAIRQEAAAGGGECSGRVRLGSFASVSAQLLPGILATLRVRNPGVEVALFEGHDDEVVGWVRDRAVDVGVISREAPDLDVRPLAADHLVAVLPAAHPLAARPRVTLGQLATEPFVLSRGGCERIIVEAFAAAGREPRVAFEVHEVATILAMVAEGLGVSVVPELSAVAVPPRVLLRPLTPAVERRLGLAVPSLADAPPAVRALLEIAALPRGGNHETPTAVGSTAGHRSRVSA